VLATQCVHLESLWAILSALVTWLGSNLWVNLFEADFEIVIAMWLLSGWARRFAWAVSLAMFAAFSVVTATKYFHGEASCGCFGSVSVPPQYTFLLDVTIVATLAFLRPKGGSWWPFTQWRRFLVAGAIAVPIVVLSAIPVLRFSWTKGTSAAAIDSGDNTVVLEPETWVGQPLPIAGHIDIAKELGRGDWLVVLVREGCSGCAALVPELAAKARAVAPGKVAKVALIHIPPHKEPSEFAHDGAQFLNGKLDATRDWFVQTPTVLRLKDGIVTDVVIAQGEANRKKVLDAELPVVQAAQGGRTNDAPAAGGHEVLFASGAKEQQNR
jgi:hypothetical protein